MKGTNRRYIIESDSDSDSDEFEDDDCNETASTLKILNSEESQHGDDDNVDKLSKSLNKVKLNDDDDNDDNVDKLSKSLNKVKLNDDDDNDDNVDKLSKSLNKVKLNDDDDNDDNVDKLSKSLNKVKLNDDDDNDDSDIDDNSDDDDKKNDLDDDDVDVDSFGRNDRKISSSTVREIGKQYRRKPPPGRKPQRLEDLSWSSSDDESDGSNSTVCSLRKDESKSSSLKPIRSIKKSDNFTGVGSSSFSSSSSNTNSSVIKSNDVMKRSKSNALYGRNNKPTPKRHLLA
jgi:hypothetical protein